MSKINNKSRVRPKIISDLSKRATEKKDKIQQLSESVENLHKMHLESTVKLIESETKFNTRIEGLETELGMMKLSNVNLFRILNDIVSGDIVTEKTKRFSKEKIANSEVINLRWYAEQLSFAINVLGMTNIFKTLIDKEKSESKTTEPNLTAVPQPDDSKLDSVATVN